MVAKLSKYTEIQGILSTIFSQGLAQSYEQRRYFYVNLISMFLK